MPKKQRSVFEKATPTLKKSAPSGMWVLLIVVLVALMLTVFLASGIPQQKSKEAQLRSFYTTLLNAERTSDFETIYNSLSYEQRRALSFEDFVAVESQDRPPLSMDVMIHSIQVDGDRGLIDRTLIACFSEACEGEDRFEQRAIKEYLYINGNWYTPLINDIDEEGAIVEQNWPTMSPTVGASGGN